MAKDVSILGVNHREPKTDYQAGLKDIIKYSKVPDNFVAVWVNNELYMTAKEQDLDSSRSVKLYRVSALIQEVESCIAESLDLLRELQDKLTALKSFK